MAQRSTAPLSIAQPLALPCGAVIKNRLSKAAMTEGLASPEGMATSRHVNVYTQWANGGTGLLLTGNIQVDKRYLERPGNVVIDGPQSAMQLERLQAFATSATQNNTHAWVQLSHAGRQTPKLIAPTPVGPSAIKLALPGGQFGTPRALEHEEIEDVVKRFAHAAKITQKVGFTGVQIHSAHGYLLSEFLNPRANVRTDQWGGSLENRARLLLQVVRAVRQTVGLDYPVSVKLNSSDFQKGGYSFEECQQVVKWLDDEGIDLLEISGGSYEQPRMMALQGVERVTDTSPSEPSLSKSTASREAYFLDYARVIAKTTSTPLMVTGGFRSVAVMETACKEGAAHMIGIARPLCVDPDASAQLLDERITELEKWEERLAIGPGWFGPGSKIKLMKMINGFSSMAFYYRNIDLLGDNQPTERNMNLLSAFIRLQLEDRRKAALIKKLQS